MWHYIISGMPSTRSRAMGKGAQLWDDYMAAKVHAEIELLDQLADTPKPHGLLIIDFIFYLPHTIGSKNRSRKIPNLYADIKPEILPMRIFAQTMLHEYILDQDTVIVSTTEKKMFHTDPCTDITITPLSYKK